MVTRITAVVLVALVFGSCDGGLEPPSPLEAGFGGTIRFVRSSWPPADSIYGLWVFTSQEALVDSSAILTGLFSNPPTIYLYPGLGGSLGLLPTDSLPYVIRPVPGTYVYTGVIQQTEPAISASALRVVGLYTKPGPGFVPDTLRIAGGEFIDGIDIAVDFHDIPPQPF